MFGKIYNNDSLKKYVTYFGILFSNVWLARYDATGKRVTELKVPLNFGPKDKFLARVEGNPDLNKPIAMQLPMMSFEFSRISYDPSRKLVSTGKMTSPNTSGGVNYQLNPVPYNIEFDLYIMVKNQEDGGNIIEQILPYFVPDLTGNITLDSEMGGAGYDIPLILMSVDHTDTYEGQFENRRTIIWTLKFMLKGWFFGPVSSGSIIRNAYINLRIPPGTAADGTTSDPISVTIHASPGLLANGSPTTNASLTIDSSLISPSDNYAFIDQYTENV